MSEKSSVSDMLEKVFLMGIGAASLTRDKAVELVDELVKRGQISKEQGARMVDEAAGKAVDASSDVMGSMSEAFRDTLRTLGIARLDQTEDLERRITVLEAKVYGKPSRIEEPGTGFVVTPTEDEAPT